MTLLLFADSAARNMSIYSFRPGNVCSDDARNSRSRHAWSHEPSGFTHGSLDIAGRLHPVDETAARRSLTTSGPHRSPGGGSPARDPMAADAGGRAAGLREAAATRETLRSPRRDRVRPGRASPQPRRFGDEANAPVAWATARTRRLSRACGRRPRVPDRQAAINLLPAAPSFSAPASAMGSNIDLAYRRLSFNKRNLAI
jgi:hypothetical protein